eukprot:TRINITY_DN5725_c0_g1_i1.p1 TRINITY_DN5725_c0_g1~~TRINITY_DN5725_c0_g1_i1.p1  ORF type:complete len:125 (-),score=12.32 TRINITY_DN5725_c0_g1_i1:65-439(-)
MGRELKTMSDAEVCLSGTLVDKQNCPQTNVGSRQYGLVMKYKINEVIEGFCSNDDKFIYVIHGAPEKSRKDYHKLSGTLKHFTIGDTHLMRLKKKISEDLSPFDEGNRFLLPLIEWIFRRKDCR